MVPLGGKAETEAKHLFFGYMFVEQGVVLLDSLLFFLVEPAAFTGQEFRFELGVQLFMLGRDAVNGVFQADTEKAAWAGAVYQQVFPVAGADERGDAGSAEALRL